MGYQKNKITENEVNMRCEVSIRELVCKECNTEFTIEHTRETNWDGTHDSYDWIIKECSCGQCKE